MIGRSIWEKIELSNFASLRGQTGYRIADRVYSQVWNAVTPQTDIPLQIKFQVRTTPLRVTSRL